MKRLELIHLNTSNEKLKDKLADTLLINGITCFGIGQHILAIDQKPEGTKVGKPQDSKQIKKILKRPKLNKIYKQTQAQLLSFDKVAFKAFKKYFSKQYLFKKQTKSTMSFKSRTQKANFTLHRNGMISVSKDLLSIDLLVSIVRICYGERPLDIASSL